jgi:hypothetical protein
MKFWSSVAAILAISFTMQGCAVQKQMVATGGSRADGTVKMAYEFGMFEMPKIDMQQGQDAATQRCKSWGYTNAEAFGGQTKTCSSFGGGACNSWLVTVEYQCTGGRVAAQ